MRAGCCGGAVCGGLCGAAELLWAEEEEERGEDEQGKGGAGDGDAETSVLAEGGEVLDMGQGWGAAVCEADVAQGGCNGRRGWMDEWIDGMKIGTAGCV